VAHRPHRMLGYVARGRGHVQEAWLALGRGLEGRGGLSLGMVVDDGPPFSASRARSARPAGREPRRWLRNRIASIRGRSAASSPPDSFDGLSRRAAAPESVERAVLLLHDVSLSHSENRPPIGQERGGLPQAARARARHARLREASVRGLRGSCTSSCCCSSGPRQAGTHCARLAARPMTRPITDLWARGPTWRFVRSPRASLREPPELPRSSRAPEPLLGPEWRYARAHGQPRSCFTRRSAVGGSAARRRNGRIHRIFLPGGYEPRSTPRPRTCIHPPELGLRSSPERPSGPFFSECFLFACSLEEIVSNLSPITNASHGAIEVFRLPRGREEGEKKKMERDGRSLRPSPGVSHKARPHFDRLRRCS